VKEIGPGLLVPFDQMTLEQLLAAEAHWKSEAAKLQRLAVDLRKLQKAVRACRELSYLPSNMARAALIWRAQREAEMMAAYDERAKKEAVAKEERRMQDLEILEIRKERSGNE
jgi:hypothetical protein